MATTYGTQMTKLRNTFPQALPDAGDVSGDVRVFSESVTLAGQTAASIIEVAKLPKGARFLYGMLTTDTSLGSTTIQIGVTGSTAAFKADAVFTATDTPTLFGKASAVGVALTAETIVIITVSTATAPSSGSLKITIFYSVN